MAKEKGLWERILIGSKIEQMIEKGYSEKRIRKELAKNGE